MRRPVLIVFLACAAFVAVFYGVGAMLDDSWRVETVRTMAAPKDVVVSKLGDLRGWQDWCSVDAVMGPNTERAVTGEVGQPGSALVWRGSEGEATLTIHRIDEHGLDYEFATSRRGVIGRGAMRVDLDGQQTRVTWTDEGRLDRLVERWVGWFGALQESVRRHQEASLGNLANRLELDSGMLPRQGDGR